MNTDTQFEIIPAGIELAQESRQSIETSFADFFAEARQWQIKTAEITEPNEAREARLKMVKVRTAAEKKRKELKDDYLRMGKAIDGANNILLALIVPLEKQMEEIEKAEERRILAERIALTNERAEKLRPFIADGTPLPPLADITDDQFQSMLADAKMLHEAKMEAAAKAEAERIDRERKEAEEREAQRLENIRLKAEAEAREAAIKAEREAREKAEREAAATKAEIERKEREAKEAEEAKARAAAEAARKAAAAPDKERVLAFVLMIRSIQAPEAKSEDGKKIMAEISDKIESFAKWIELQAAKL